MIVFDASAAVCLLLDYPLERADRLRERLRGEEVHVPNLVDLEVVQAFRGRILRGELTPERARTALDDLADLPLIRYPHHPFLDDVWRMRSNRTAYDAMYVALAERLEASLITLDARMARTPAAVPIEVF